MSGDWSEPDAGSGDAAKKPAPGLDARGLALEFSCDSECGDCSEAAGERRGVASLLILPGLVIDSLCGVGVVSDSSARTRFPNGTFGMLAIVISSAGRVAAVRAERTLDIHRFKSIIASL